MKKRTAAIAPVVIVLLSITLVNCGDDNGSTGPTPGGGEEPKTGYAHFMPLSVGNEWIYDYLYSDETGPQETGAYYLRIVDKLENYLGFEAYVADYKQEPWEPYVYYMVLGCDGDKCYRFTSPWWEYVVEDDMEWLAWSQTGLLTYYKLQLNSVEDVTVPAGTFKDCKRLQIILRGSSSTYIYEEYYARDAGLVYYRYRHERSSTDWSQAEYKLKSYKVKKPL